MFMISLIVGITGFLGFLIGFWEWWEERSFLKKVATTKGQIIGSIGAKYKTEVSDMIYDGIDTSYEFTTNSGGLLLVQYEVNGYVYKVRSRQPFDSTPNQEINVQYNPKKPSEAIIDGFYSGNSKYFQLFGGLACMLPLLYYAIFG